MRRLWPFAAIVLGALAACDGALTSLDELDGEAVDAGSDETTLPAPEDTSIPPSLDGAAASDADTPVVDASLVVDAGVDAPPDADASIDAAVDADGASPPVDTVVQVAGGGDHSCFRFASGQVRCAGLNSVKTLSEEMNPKLGDGLTVHAGCPIANADCSFKPVLVVNLSDAVEIGVGARHSCARKADGTVVCWGQNENGELGDGTNTARATPVAVSGLSDVVQLSVSSFVTCARKSTGEAVCWGKNDRGQVGDGTLTMRKVPTPVSGLADAIDIAAGEGACAIRAGGQAVCWGINRYGQLGDGVLHHSVCASFDCSKVPVDVSGITDAILISRGSGHVCAVRANGTMWCWGMANNGALGDGVTDHGNYPTWNECRYNDCQPTPVMVVNMASPTQIVAASGHTCALRPTGVVSCWGNNSLGSLGAPPIPNTQLRFVPGDVAGVADALSVAGHGHDYCAVRPGGRVSCWGRNFYGELANGNHAITYTPTDVVW